VLQGSFRLHYCKSLSLVVSTRYIFRFSRFQYYVSHKTVIQTTLCSSCMAVAEVISELYFEVGSSHLVVMKKSRIQLQVLLHCSKISTDVSQCQNILDVPL
jgi:hypothetical protein